MIEVEIEDASWTDALPKAEALAMTAALAALSALHAEAPDPGDVAILLTDDGAVADLNQRFRGKPGPTNVLSFPAPESPGGPLGDIALAYGVCAREAGEQGKSLGDHLQHLVAHGVLHLLGYDHLEEREAEEMEALERRILAGLDIPDPYS